MKTIAISAKIHKQISSFGRKGETYNKILERLDAYAYELKFTKALLDLKDTTDIRDVPW